LRAPAFADASRPAGKIAAPGQVLRLLVAAKYSGAWCVYDGTRYRFLPAGNYQRALVPVEADTKPRTASTLSVYAPDGELLFSERVYHPNPHFPVVRLKLSASKKKLYTSRRIPDSRRKIRAALCTQSARQLWHGKFSFPAKGRHSAPFGQRRVSGKKTLSYHLGLDIAVPVGTPVRAVNDGTVLLAGLFPLQGNAVYIDHGQGVVSACFHMSRVLVKAGDRVSKGTVIGKSGNTGISTGPHLHWSMFVHGIPVNPSEWVRQEF
jgi:murein DD-endopeptidase MepM/ murein hydrolase activator NlpD